MKKLFKYLLLASLSLVMLLGNATNTYAANATISGPSEVRAGDTITLSLNINDPGKYGFEGTLVYDTNQVTLSSMTTSLSGWEVESEGNTVIAYDDGLSNPISGTKTVLTLKFKVKSTVETGSKINISVDGIITTDGSNENQIGTATYSVTVARPLSTNANLASLSVAGVTLNPAFAAGTTTYNLGEVEYSVKSLNITCATEDSNAKYTIKNNTLSVGNNTVSIVVTAENGTSKTYKLNVTRKQDPNYVAGSNANLKSLKVSQGILSPVFSATVTDYIVYLPYECIGTSFTASGTEADSKAQGVIDGAIDKLVEGKNQTVVVCKAEDGTEKTYAITVYVMPKYDGTIPNIGGSTGGNDNPGTDPGNTESPGTDPGTTEEPGTDSENTENLGTEPESSEEPDSNPSEKPSQTPDTPSNGSSGNSGIVTILVILVVVALVGALIYVLFFSKKR